MKRSRSIDGADSGQQDLDPLAVALMALGQQAVPMEGPLAAVPSGPAQASKAPKHSRRDYVWRGPHRQELKQHSQQLDAAAGEDAGHSSSRRSSATHGVSSDGDDEVAQRQRQQRQRQQQQQRYQRQQPQQQPKQQQKLQRQKDAAKEWAALTTWLRMNLHNPRTSRRVILFTGSQDASTGSWGFSLNPEVEWADVGVETKLRLKTLLQEAEQAFAAKYPGRPAHEWQAKVQKYKPPGSDVAAEVPLWDVVHGLHSIYLQHEEPTTASTNHTGQQQQQQVGPLPQMQQQLQQQQASAQEACSLPIVPPAAAAHLAAAEQQVQQQPQQQQ